MKQIQMVLRQIQMSILEKSSIFAIDKGRE
nr:MAG TPA: hypothetical protein [Microviridae sp.]